MIIDSIKEYLKSCPLLENGKININCLGAGAASYSIDTMAVEPIIRTYCDGGTLKQLAFVFALRMPYDEDSEGNTAAAVFFEELQEWIEKQDSAGILPDISDGKIIPEKIEVTKGCCLYDSSIDSARYQMEMRLIYRQER